MKKNAKDIVEQLVQLREAVLVWERVCLQEVMRLQEVLNNRVGSEVVRRVVIKQSDKQQEKMSLGCKEIEEEVQGIIGTAHEQLREIHNPKQKQEKPPIVASIKKPPIPTVKKNINHNPVVMAPPRNKNQVTGKITQSKIITQNQVFKPENQLKNKRISQSVDKPQTASKILTNCKQKSTDNGQKIKQNQIQSTTLTAMSKTVQQINESYMRRDKDKTKGVNLDIALEKYSLEQMGYRNKQQKSRQLFVKHMGCLAATQSVLPVQLTHYIDDRGWQGCAWVQDLGDVIKQLQQNIQQHKKSIKDIIDPRNAYKLLCLETTINKKLYQLDDLKQSIVVPQFIDLNFRFRAPEQGENQINKGQQVKEEEKIYDILMGLIEGFEERDSLTGQSLGLLKVLCEVGLFNCKRCPVIVQSQKHEEWVSKL